MGKFGELDIEKNKLGYHNDRKPRRKSRNGFKFTTRQNFVNCEYKPD